jgi:hypothetical protein
MLRTKFVHLKHLDISVSSGRASLPYDYFSLVSFLDASPSLETLSLDVRRSFIPSCKDIFYEFVGPINSIVFLSHLQVSMENKKHESVIGHSSPWRQMDEHPHCSLKSVKITGFSSAKSLVELTCYILKNAVSLDCLRLDTLYGSRCSDENYDRCHSMSKGILTEASIALVAIRTYIEYKVPTKVKLIVLEPCSQCHAFVWEGGKQVPFNLAQRT